VIVRPAKIEDIQALAAIAERSYRAAFADILEEDVLASRSVSYFEERFAAAWERMLVALAGQTPLGFLLMTDGHIDMLFMDPDAGGRGAARFCCSGLKH
jgi:putative acetyltransferase